ncbi:hypothetical protein JCM6882_008442 [Rhodosporidiobolus microsporus]
MSSSEDDLEKLKRPLLHRSRRSRSPTSHPLKHVKVAALVLLALAVWRWTDAQGLLGRPSGDTAPSQRPLKALTSSADQQRWSEAVERCEELDVLPGVPKSFWERNTSDRFASGTPPTLIRNATVWTGNDDGKEVLHGHDVLLDRGLVIKIGRDIRLDSLLEDESAVRAKIVDAHGAWVTPGIVDMHSHVGVDALPGLSGASDTNSHAGAVLPHLRSLDGINGHDLAYRRVAAGGVTTSLVLPGSANNVGGQAFVIKLRPTAERTIVSRVLELPWNVVNPNGEKKKRGDPPRWRHMKMACGENIRRVYGQTRLDLAWNFRSNFDSARHLKQKQDSYCSRALDAHRGGRVLTTAEGEVEQFPDDLKQEALVDALRGKVKINVHCYETTDLDAFIRHTHEFRFPIAAFHHAHETFLVPELLRNAWPGNGSSTPAVALFSTNGAYKREAWRGSPYAGKILSENNISVIYKSDHPVSDSRYLLFQAQQAHHFDLPTHLALSSVTTTPARVAGLDHRVGFLRPKYDADAVLWTSHPLSLGATPQQVWIDGIAQVVEPHPPAVAEPEELTRRNGPSPASLPAHYDPTREQEDDGFDFLNPGEKRLKGTEIVERVKFTNVGEAFVPSPSGLKSLGEESGVQAPFEVDVEGGEIVCVERSCATSSALEEVRVVDLQGGSLFPPLAAYGTAAGLVDIVSEKSTLDGSVFDPLFQGGLSATQQHLASTTAVKAVDGLVFGGKHLQVAEGAGVGKALVFPQGDGFLLGVGAALRTSAKNVLEDGAVVRDVTALHIQIGHGGKGSPSTPSISTQIAYLRSLLLSSLDDASSNGEYTSTNYFSLVAQGRLPLVIHANKADIFATLINLKKEIETASGREQRWIIHGGQEAHLLAPDLAAANIAVILTPVRSLPEDWDQRRALPGPPLTPRGPIEVLHDAGVKVAIGIQEEYQLRALLWEAAWAQRLTDGRVSRKEAVGWVSSALEELFDLSEEREEEEGRKVEFVAFERDPFEFGSRLVAASTFDGRVKLFL